MDLVYNVKSACLGIAEYFGIKIYSSFLLTFGAYLIGVEHFPILTALMVLAVIDFVTGLASAKISGEVITSRKAVKSATKFVVYVLFAAAAHLSEMIVPGETYFETVVISFLALTEFISIIENIGKMGFAIPLKLLNKLKEYRDDK